MIRYLGERLTAVESEAETALSKAQQQRLTQIDNLQKKFSDQPQGFRTNFGTEDNDDTELKNEFETEVTNNKTVVATVGDPEGERIKSTNSLADCARRVVIRRDQTNKREIADLTYRVRDNLRSDFSPRLISYVDDRRTHTPHPNVISEMVLDRGRSTHVIYQVIELTFIAILVFGLLFPIYLLLRALPPFASSVEPLGERAKGFLSRDGITSAAAPAIVKTAVLSIAAIGIGAAVVIANNPAAREKAAEDEVNVADGGSRFPPKGPPKSSPPPSDTPGPTTTPSPEVGGPTPNPTPVINVYPQFFPTVSTNGARLKALEDLRVGPRLDVVEGSLPLKADAAKLNDLVSNKQLTDKLTTSENALRGEIKTVKDDVTTLNETTVQGINKTISDKSQELSSRIDASGRTLAGYHEGTQGRSFSARVKELFGREKYLVTKDNLEVLRQLICTQPCGTDTPEGKLMTKLQVLLIEGKQLSKKTFQTRLGLGSSSTLTHWEPVILRYTRLAY